MPAEAVPEVQQGLVELWLYKFWVFEGPATLGAQELQAYSSPFASTSLRSAGAEAPLVRERSTVTWAIVDRHQGDPATSASVDRRLALGRWPILSSPGSRTRER